MVLQDLGDPTPDNGGDPSSQYGPYAPARSPGPPRFDPSQLPRSIGITWDLRPSQVQMRTQQGINYAEQKLHRSMTQAEVQALAYHYYRIEQIKSGYALVGSFAGVYRWYSTMADSRYPFYKPKAGTVDPNKFLFFRGQSASFARHSWRLMLYNFVGAEMGKLIGTIMAQPLAARGASEDPALTQFAADLRVALSGESQKQHDVGAQRRAEWEERIRRRNAGTTAASTNTQSNSAQFEDDMSPTAGNDTWGSSNSDYFSNDDSASSSSFTQETSQEQRPVQRQQPRNSWARQQQQRRQDEDDASPTGGLFQDEVESQPTSNESAWERLRRGAGPAPTSRTQSRRPELPHREQREGSTLGDSFTFADSDDERRIAQEKAQREFDERIERERQGKGFNDEKRW